MKSNFEFLNEYWSDLAELGADAEWQLFYDNSACILKLGTFAEKLADEILYSERLEEYIELNQYDKIVLLENKGILPENIKSIFHRIRILRNKVGHDNEQISDKKAERCLIDAYNLAGWFTVIYNNKKTVIPKYKTPNYDVENTIETSKQSPIKVKKVINLNPVLLIAFIISVSINIILICR